MSYIQYVANKQTVELYCCVSCEQQYNVECHVDSKLLEYFV